MAAHEIKAQLDQPSKTESTANAAASARLKEGEVLQVVATTRTVPDSSPPKEERGVIVGGRFAPVNIPNEVKDGEKILVKVVSTKEGPALQYLERVPDSSKSAVTEKLTKAILDDLKLTESALLKLKEVALGKGEPYENNLLSHVLKTSPKLLKEIAHEGVITETHLQDPKALAEALKRGSSPELLQKIQTVIRDLQRSANSSPIPHLFDPLRALERALEDLLPHAERKNEPRVIIPTKAQHSPAERLKNALSENLVVHESTSQSGGDFKNLIDSQLKTLEINQTRVQRLLVAPGHEAPLQTLLRTLEGTERTSTIDPNIPEGDQKRFIEFVKTLRAALVEALSSSKPEGEIKELLKAALKTLYDEFGLTEIGKRVQENLPTPNPLSLNREQTNTLKLLEAQIKTILDSPEGILSLELASLNDEKPLSTTDYKNSVQPIIKLLRQLQSNTSTLSPDEPFAIFISKSITSLEDLQSGTPKVGETRALLQKVLSQVEEFLKPQGGRDDKSTLRNAYQGGIKAIDSLIREIFEDSERRAHSAPSPSANLQNNGKSGSAEAQKISTIKELLKKVISAVPEFGTIREHEARELSEEAKKVIEREATRDMSSVKHELKKTLDTTRDRFKSSYDPQESSPLNNLDLASLKKLENITNSAETLRALNPLMKSLGEPIMILFPMIMHGLLTKALVTGYPSTSPDRAERDKEQQKKGEGQSLQRFHLELPLSSLGNVEVDIAHNRTQVYINFAFEDENTCHYVQEKLPLLEASLNKSGYVSVEMRAASVSKGSK